MMVFLKLMIEKLKELKIYKNISPVLGLGRD